MNVNTLIQNGFANLPALTYIVMENNFHLTVICFIFSSPVAIETQSDVAVPTARSWVMRCLYNGPLLIVPQLAPKDPRSFAGGTGFV